MARYRQGSDGWQDVFTWHRLAAVMVSALLCTPLVAAAQDSREETIVAAQAEKATHLAPYVPNRAEVLLSRVLSVLTVEPNGFYPMLGSIYSGGGFTLGAGYRHFVSDRASLNVSGLYSIKRYQLFEVAFDAPGTPRGRPEFNVKAGWRDATQVGYRGLGIDSPEDRSNFRMEQGYGGGEIGVRPRSWAIFKAGLLYEDYTLSEGSGSAPSIEQVHTPATAPGLGANPTYLHTNASAAIDTRLAPQYARRGGLYELAYHKFSDRDDTYTFDRLDAEVVQHIPILRENWVISLRGRLQTTLRDDDVVPYFLLPALGSGSSLRGYSSWRFRDRHSLLFSGEYRWIPSRLALDAAIFYDAGTVADRFDALSIGTMKSDFGFGVRFHSLVATPLRIELAKGSEGLRLVLAGSAAF